MSRRWTRRLALTVSLAVGAVLGTWLLGFEPDVVRVLLLAALGVVSVVVLVEAAPREPVAWYPTATHAPLGRGRDGATAAHLRHLENHQASRHPDAALRDRLLATADAVLQARHGVRADTEQGRAIMGAALCEALHGRVVRMSPRRIDQVLRTIEEL